MNKTPVALIFLFVTVVSVTLACGGETVKQTGTAQPRPTFQNIPTTNSEIVFAGKVVNPNNGEWTNNRLVLVFLNSKEIARTTTSTMDYTATTRALFFDPNLYSDSDDDLEAFSCTFGISQLQ